VYTYKNGTKFEGEWEKGDRLGDFTLYLPAMKKVRDLFLPSLSFSFPYLASLSLLRLSSSSLIPFLPFCFFFFLAHLSSFFCFVVVVVVVVVAKWHCERRSRFMQTRKGEGRV
jgi:hypothetical protein